MAMFKSMDLETLPRHLIQVGALERPDSLTERDFCMHQPSCSDFH